MKKAISYACCHQRLKRKYGNALKCENKKCVSVKPKRFEWALKKGRIYSDNKKDYLQLCPSCHRKYDYTDEQRSKISKAHLGMKLYDGGMEKWVLVGIEASKKHVLQISLDGIMIKDWSSITEACNALKILNSSISNCIKGSSKTAGGFIWKLKN